MSNSPIDRIQEGGATRAACTLRGERSARLGAISCARADLAGDPTLELFTSSRLDARITRWRESLKRRLETRQASEPLQYIVQGDYAVATSKRPARGFVPILLHREDGLWRIDLVETWKNLFFDADGNYFLRNSNTPYAFALKQFGSGQSYDLAAEPLGDAELSRWIEALDRDDVVASMLRAELWMRNAFVAPQALLDYERAAPRAARPLGTRKRLASGCDTRIP